MNPAATLTAAYAEADARAAFIRKTYAHLAGALALFAGLEYLLITSPLGEQIAGFVFDGQYRFLMLLGGFILTGWLARGFAQRIDSPAAVVNLENIDTPAIDELLHPDLSEYLG